MVSAIGIVPVALYLFKRNGNVLSVFSAFCVEVAINVLELCRITVRIIATANGRIIGHVPCRIEFLVKELILRWMVVKPGLTLSILSLDRHHHHTANRAA
jgi:hypothetical protein